MGWFGLLLGVLACLLMWVALWIVGGFVFVSRGLCLVRDLVFTLSWVMFVMLQFCLVVV